MYDATRSRRAQDCWDDHAAFLDTLAERGTVLRGGPLGDDVDSGDALLVVLADDTEAVRATLSRDPWHGTILTITSVERWSLWLRSPSLAKAIGADDVPHLGPR
jgi:uncharacterized protein YciI